MIPVSPPYKVKISRHPYSPYSGFNEIFTGIVLGYKEHMNARDGESAVLFLIQVQQFRDFLNYGIHWFDPDLWRIEIVEKIAVSQASDC